MSSINKIVAILAVKYGFDIKEATEHVNSVIQSYKSLTAEEKAGFKEAEKEFKKQAKAQEMADKKAEREAKKAEREAKKAEKESKPKKPRTEKQEAAFQKMIAANKAKKEAKLAANLLETENVVVEPTITPPLTSNDVSEMLADLVDPTPETKKKREKKTKTVEGPVQETLPPLVIPEDTDTTDEKPVTKVKKVKKVKKTEEPVVETSNEN